MFKFLLPLAAPALLFGGLSATPAAAAAPVAASGLATPAWADVSAYQYRRNDRYRTRDAYRQGRRDQRARARYNDQRYADNRYDNRYRECDRGVGGTAIGAVAGGLLGNQVAGRGDKTGGSILGAVVGGVLGNVIDRRDDPCRGRNQTRGYRR